MSQEDMKTKKERATAWLRTFGPWLLGAAPGAAAAFLPVSIAEPLMLWLAWSGVPMSVLVIIFMVRSTRAGQREDRRFWQERREEMAEARRVFARGNEQYRAWRSRTLDAIVVIHNAYIEAGQREHADALRPLIKDLNGGQPPPWEREAGS